MPITEPITGDEFELYVSATQGGTYVIVDGLNSFRRRSNRGQQSTSFFGRSQQVTTYGKREVTFSVGGSPIPDDPGQKLLRDTEAGAAGSTCWVRVQYASGTGNFYLQQVRVGSREHAVDNPDNLQGVTFDFTSVGEPIVTGSAVVL